MSAYNRLMRSSRRCLSTALLAGLAATAAAQAPDTARWNKPAEPLRSANPFVDPEGFRAHVASRKRAFEEQLARERGGRPGS